MTQPLTEPVCPRHPDQVSYVRCQRCEEPVCPECQRSAAVGVQCVDCVREESKSIRSARTVFGGRPFAGPAAATFSLMAICIVGLLAQLASGGTVTELLAFTPSLALDQPWRFVTSAFLHSTTFTPHIAFNMLVLYQVGPTLEVALGRLRFLLLYFLCAVGGSVGYLTLAQPTDLLSWQASVIGASGAVFGLFGALIVAQRRLGMSGGGLFVLVGVNFAIGLLFSSVAWQSHLGGLLTGIAAGLCLALPSGPGRNVRQFAGLAALALVLVVISARALI